MIDFSTLQGLTIPEGVVTQITDASGRVLWAVPSGDKVILEVEKATSNTYSGNTTYENEQFILLDIYPKTNGTVTVTYGGLTKTITDTSGVAEPNAQQVVFGTLYGETYDAEVPASGELTIEGDYYAFGCGRFAQSKSLNYVCSCVTKIRNWGLTEVIPPNGFNTVSLKVGPGLAPGKLVLSNKIKRIEKWAFGNTQISGDLVIPSSVESIGDSAFNSCSSLTTVTLGEGIVSIGSGAFSHTMRLETTKGLKKITVLTRVPPELTAAETTDDSGNVRTYYSNFGYMDGQGVDDRPEQIIVPKGCGNTYKTAEGWSTYADRIVEAS